MIFKPEDFQQIDHYENNLTPCFAASQANEKLNALIESWPVVYVAPDFGGTGTYAHTSQDACSTHTARLAFIEPIKREPCKHEPQTTVMNADTSDVFRTHTIKTLCKHCGVELTATWSAK